MEDETRIGRESGEIPQTLGKLIVITGRSGSGKDFVMDLMLYCESLQTHGLKRVVTHASRSKRENETNGVDYHFVSQEELFALYDQGLLVETPVMTGTSYKGTSKSELARIMEGENLVWRIELSRAADVAGGDFFGRLFDEKTAEMLRQSTVVILIDVDRETLVQRRRNRDGVNYDEQEYEERDRQEQLILNQFGDKFSHVIRNDDGETEKTKDVLEKLLCALLD